MASNDQRSAVPQEIRPMASIMKLARNHQRNGLKQVVYFNQVTCCPSDVFCYGREAVHCFMDRRYLATVVMADPLIELILNKDLRMVAPERHWDALNMKTIRAAKRSGLPIDRLLEPGENLKGKSILFVDLRNKIAHGNLSDLIGFENRSTTDYSSQARAIALNHLEKAQLFEVDWFNFSPDVQRGRILQSRWPDRAKKSRS